MEGPVQFKDKHNQLYPLIEDVSNEVEGETVTEQYFRRIENFIRSNKIPLRIEGVVEDVRDPTTKCWTANKIIRISDKRLLFFGKHVEFNVTPNSPNEEIALANLVSFYNVLVKDLPILAQVRKAKGSLVKAILHGKQYQRKYFDNELNKTKHRYLRYGKRVAIGFGVSLAFFGFSALI